MTRILVTGGTGYIGGALLRHLMRSEVDARALVHDKARSFLLPQGVEFHTVDEPEDSATGFDAVVHLGYGTALGRKETLIRNRDFADKVVRLAARSNAKVIYAGTTAVGGYSVDPGMDYVARLSGYSNDDTYTYVKGHLEDHVLEACAKRNVPLTVVRIGNVMGPASLWARTVLGHLTKGVPFLVEGAPSNTTSIYNLVELLKRESESADGSGIILSAEMSEVTWPEWAENLIPEPFKGILDVGRLRISEASRSSAGVLPRLAAGLYRTVMSSPRLKSLVARAPKRILSMTEPWVKVPSVQATKAMAKPPLSEIERLIFSGKNAVPALGVTDSSLAYTAKRIMEWAVWANYFVEHEARQ